MMMRIVSREKSGFNESLNREIKQDLSILKEIKIKKGVI